MARRHSEDEKQDTGRWLTTYSDMMNNLLVLFMVLYAMSIMDMKKFEALASQLNSAFNKTVSVEEVKFDQDGDENIELAEALAEEESEDTFDELYERIKQEIAEKGYEDIIVAEKGENYIKFRFNDNVIFYPDSSKMKPESYDILAYVGGVLLSVDDQVEKIEIGGHTATVNGGNESSFFAWELSSNRAIAVLKFLATECSLPQSKMSVSGYSHYSPVSSNDTEESRSLNRRVEIKISRLVKN